MMNNRHFMTMTQSPFDVSSLMTNKTPSNQKDDLLRGKSNIDNKLRNANTQIHQLHKELAWTFSSMNK